MTATPSLFPAPVVPPQAVRHLVLALPSAVMAVRAVQDAQGAAPLEGTPEAKEAPYIWTAEGMAELEEIARAFVALGDRLHALIPANPSRFASVDDRIKRLGIDVEGGTQ